MELLILALVIVASLITTLVRVFSIKLLFGYAVIVDLVFSLTITAAFMGTFKGVIAATLAGLILGVALSIGKALMGFQRAKIGRSGRFWFKVELIEYPGLIQRMKTQGTDTALIKIAIAQIYKRMKAAGL